MIFFNWPTEITRMSDIKRGEILIKKIEQYQQINNTLPETSDWEVLKSIGFTNEEMETAYPEYSKSNYSTFQITFVLGFEPPYLNWNSEIREWKNAFPHHKNP